MDASTTVSTLQQFLIDIGTVITAVGGWVGEIVQVILGNPVFLVPIGLGLAGGAIGLFHSLKG